ncbi:MAG: hypothetical protein DRI34_00170 [Deltaproteobacteria bacterium]|nr:MAG: hypothetical protein DRI34_00170 [Deltaproteobacteria bacterium]
MTWVMTECQSIKRGSLCSKLAELIPRDFPGGFTVDQLLDHPALDDEDREEIRWHAANGALVYGFGNGIYCRRSGSRWEIVDYRSQRALWFGALLKELGLDPGAAVRTDDARFLRALDAADLKVRREVGPPGYPPGCNGRMTEPDSEAVFASAAEKLQERFGPTPLLTFDLATWITTEIDIARVQENSRLQSGDDEPLPPLSRAAWNGDLDLVRKLIAEGADVDRRDETDNRALDYAAIRGDLPIVELLVSAGADVRAAGPDGSTVLHSAMESCNLDVVRYLVEQGAEVNARMDDTTPLHLAGYGSPPELIDYLVAQGADVNAVDGAYTPLDNAMFTGNREIVRLLKKHGGRFRMDLT